MPAAPFSTSVNRHMMALSHRLTLNSPMGVLSVHS